MRSLVGSPEITAHCSAQCGALQQRSSHFTQESDALPRSYLHCWRVMQTIKSETQVLNWHATCSRVLPYCAAEQQPRLLHQVSYLLCSTKLVHRSFRPKLLLTETLPSRNPYNSGPIPLTWLARTLQSGGLQLAPEQQPPPLPPSRTARSGTPPSCQPPPPPPLSPHPPFVMVMC